MSGGSQSSIVLSPWNLQAGGLPCRGGGASAGVIHLNFGMVIIQGSCRPPYALIRSCQE